VTPSSLPLWANIGPRTQSPTAQMPQPRAALVIDLDEAALIELDARTGREQIARERTSPDRDDQLVERQGFLALRVAVNHGDGVALNFRARHLGTQANIKPLLLELALRLLRDLLIYDRKKVRQRLENGELAAQAAPYGCRAQGR